MKLAMSICPLILHLQLFMYEALGLCKEGEGGHLIDSGEWIQNRNGENSVC